MIEKIQQFYEKKAANKYIVLGVLMLILGIPFGFFLVSKITGQQSETKQNDGLVLESDKSFDDIRSNYYEDGKNANRKSIESEDDFFAVEKRLDTLQSTLEKESFYNSSETSQEMMKLQEAIKRQKEKAEENSKSKNSTYSARGFNSSSGANNSSGSGYGGSNSGSTAMTKQEKEVSEYQRLAEMKEFMLENSQDYNRKTSKKTDKKTVSQTIKVRAAIYKNQLIIPGERVRLILTQPLVIGANMFEENTQIYAVANINESRVLLNIENINGIAVDLMVKDINDQMDGLYSKQAGELWKQYENEQNDTAVDGAIDEINTGIPIVNTSIQAIGGFFKGKKINKSEKILLINDHEVILTNKE